jgi:ABC-type sugar transport system ATPase subunit
MLDLGLLGRIETVTQELKLCPDNTWKANMIITHQNSWDGETWEKKSAQMTSYSDSPERALAMVIRSMTTYLSAIEFDLFKDKDNDKIDGPKN